MNIEFLKEFLKKTSFPAEAEAFFIESGEKINQTCAEDFDGAIEFFSENDFSIRDTAPLVDEIAEKAGLSPFTVWELVLIEASVPMRKAFTEEGDEQVFWDTFSDLRYKAIECKNVQGVWGNFVSFWYPIFYTKDIVKLGRLEYENVTYNWDKEYVFGDITLKKGVKVKSVHIPSSGEPFDEQARLESYKRAYEYFSDDLINGKLVIVCDSWLLYPKYGEILSEDSNIVSFQHDFDIVGSHDDVGEFHDSWRLYGADYKKPTADLPENTSMQRAIKKHLLSGGKTGEGAGIIIFDGEKILNNRK